MDSLAVLTIIFSEILIIFCSTLSVAEWLALTPFLWHYSKLLAISLVGVGVKLKVMHLLYEPRHEKTGFLHMQKQRRRSAA